MNCRNVSELCGIRVVRAKREEFALLVTETVALNRISLWVPADSDMFVPIGSHDVLPVGGHQKCS
jgi:hypothetical protein